MGDEKRLCAICQQRTCKGSMCKLCGKSYDRDLPNNEKLGVMGAILWAARRARFFERRRRKKRLKP